MNELYHYQAELTESLQSSTSNFKTPIDSESLFRKSDIVLILHKGEQYSLRRTRNGKLILNK